MSTITNTTPAPSGPQGVLISVSSNVTAALMSMVNYLQSTYNLQAADTQLQAAISNQETTVVEQFEAQENSSSGNLYLLEHLDPTTDKNYTSDVSNYSTRFGADQAANQALTKGMDANNTTAQNTLSSNSQGQQGVITTMQSLLGIGSNLVAALRG